MKRLWRDLALVGMGLALWACAAVAAYGCASQPERPACSEAALAALTFDCRAKVKRECTPGDENCQALKDCDKLIDEWEACQ